MLATHELLLKLMNMADTKVGRMILASAYNYVYYRDSNKLTMYRSLRYSERVYDKPHHSRPHVRG